VIKPLRTAALDREIKETSTGKDTQATLRGIAGTMSGILGVPTTTLGLTGTTTQTREMSLSSERKQFSSRITQQGRLGVVWWGFNIDDPNEREGGIEISDTTLPSVEFEFLGASDIPPPLPGHVCIEVASYWSIIRSSGNDHSWIQKLLSTASKTRSYSTLCLVVTLKVPSTLTKRSAYKATLHVNTGYKSGYNFMVRRPGSVEVEPLIRFGNDCSPVESRKHA
jgi:hypothetical protein